MFKRTTAINKIKAMKARKKVIQGGTSSGKTYGIIPVIIDLCTKKERIKATIVAETLPAVKEGAMDIFKNVMYDCNRWIESHWNASTLTYTFSNKSRIQFKSFDTVGKAKASGKRDILFLNEGNHIAFEIADALMIRSKQTFIDFNPDEEFWVHKETLQEPNSEFCLINYEDNEALPEETLEDILIKKTKAFFNTELPYPEIFSDQNIKNTYWANWSKVYIYGQIGSLEGVIFSNWQQIDTIPIDAKYIGNGLDFGYSNDPTACIDFYEWNGKVIWDEKIYQKGLLNSEISKKIKENNLITIADSAEPKSISEIRLNGINIIPAEKGKDSIMFGINLIQERDFLVTSQSINLIKELRRYLWRTDKTGSTLNVPIDDFNHAIDAARYFYLYKFKPNRGNYKGKTHGKIKRNTRREYYKNVL